MGFSSRKKVRFETRETRKERESKENRGTKKSREAIPKRRTNRTSTLVSKVVSINEDLMEMQRTWFEPWLS